jgi:DNA-binding NarL/FixJ family response regulator
MKILIVDDHPLFLEGISLLIQQLDESLQVNEVESGEKALEFLKVNPDTGLVLADLDMPVMSGFEFLEALEQKGQLIPVAILSATSNLYDVKKALQMGAVGFISKTSDREEMRHALDTIFRGDVYIPSGIEEQLETLMARDGMDPNEALRLKAKSLGVTRRQLQVLQLLAKGYSNKKIADEIDLTERTVKAHVSALFTILNVSNRTECVLEGERLGLTETEEQHQSFTLADD